MLNRIKKREKLSKMKLLIVSAVCMLCLAACGIDKDVETDEGRTEFLMDSESQQDDIISDNPEQNSDEEEEVIGQDSDEEEEVIEQDSDEEEEVIEQDSDEEEEVIEQDSNEEEEVIEQDSNVEEIVTEQNIEYKVTEAYNDFISQGTYDQYTENWDTVAEKYSILDINNDGIPELFINSASMGPGWFTTLIFTYNVDTSEVVLVLDEYNYGGIRYSAKHNAILYTDTKPSIMFGGESFYELQGTDLIFKFFVGHDTDENGSYCFYNDGTSSTNISEDERDEYFQDLIEIEYIDLGDNL